MDKPEFVAALEAAYGAPSQAGFGSAVFYEPLLASDDLEQAALAKYKYFVGELWERYGEDAWMGPWKVVYTRAPGGSREIVNELSSIQDLDARSSASMILDSVSDADQARVTLSEAFDDPDVAKLVVYNIGDGAAMSGILIVGQRKTQETTFLVFLLD
jgi:nitroreductase